MEKLQELFTDRVNNTLGATKKHFYDKFEVEQNLNRLDMLKQFIKWLVDNDKIDFRKLDPKINDSIPTRYYLGTYIRYSFEKEILMTLSIQDEPISFLTSILK